MTAEALEAAVSCAFSLLLDPSYPAPGLAPEFANLPVLPHLRPDFPQWKEVD